VAFTSKPKPASVVMRTKQVCHLAVQREILSPILQIAAQNTATQKAWSCALGDWSCYDLVESRRATTMTIHTGRHFLQIPDQQMFLTVFCAPWTARLYHRGLEFAQLGAEVLEGVKSVFKPRIRS